MLILLAVATLIALFLVLLGERRAGDGLAEVGGSFVRAAVIWGAYLTISSEALTPLNGLTQLGVALAWLAPLLILAYLGWSRKSLRLGVQRLGRLIATAGRAERWVVLAMGLVAGVLFVVAWLSPPNNVDSLLYHMSRVVHWAQNHSLRHYATAYNHQLLKPIWAESAILQLRLLWGSDRVANLVQWSSMIGSVFGTVALAASLGANRTGRLLTAAFVITIPMGILQSTSTQNDYVVAFWSVCTAFLVTQAALRPPPLIDKICLALVLGIGFLTKGTYYVYGPLFAIWYFVVRWRQAGFRRMAVEGMAMAVLAAALNLGFWARNVATYGGPYGTSDWLQKNLWIRFLPTESADATEPMPIGHASPVPSAGPAKAAAPEAIPPEAATSVAPPAKEPSGFLQFVARVVRTGAFNFVTPVRVVNVSVEAVLMRFPAFFPEGYMEQWRSVAWNHEDTASNPLHFVLILAAAAMLIVLGRQSAVARVYILMVLGTYLMIPIVIGHGPTIWGMRYQLPFFVIAGPLFALLATRLDWRGGAPLIAGAVIVMALPWLIFNNTRPLVGRIPWPTRTNSVLTAPPAEILLASNRRLVASYVEGTTLVRESGCTRVGLRIDSDDLEYALWWLLQAPESGIRLESIYPTDRSRSLQDPDFRPCAILCTICSNRDRLHGLPLAADLDRLDVFLGPGYVADPDG